MDYQDIIDFWFVECKPQQWFAQSDAFDALITERFLPMHDRASRGECFDWRDSIDGRLAEIIVLDQFSRNIYRHTAKAFAQDIQALTLAQEAVSLGIDRQLEFTERSFLYMPYMHSESSIVHDEAERLYRQLNQQDNYHFELKHKAIIERFGRYPHRNALLGRQSSAEELDFLQQPGSSF